MKIYFSTVKIAKCFLLLLLLHFLISLFCCFVLFQAIVISKRKYNSYQKLLKYSFLNYSFSFQKTYFQQKNVFHSENFFFHPSVQKHPLLGTTMICLQLLSFKMVEVNEHNTRWMEGLKTGKCKNSLDSFKARYF